MPCIGQSVTFDFCDAYLLHSNLGGQGPDASAPESIRYVNVARVTDEEGSVMHFDLELTATSGYRPFNSSRNGLHGCFGKRQPRLQRGCRAHRDHEALVRHRAELQAVHRPGAERRAAHLVLRGRLCVLRQDGVQRARLLRRRADHHVRLSADASKYSIITLGDANIKAHAVYGEVAVGGRFIDGTNNQDGTVCSNPGITGVPCSGSIVGEIFPSNAKWNFQGPGYTLDALPFVWTDFEALALSLKQGSHAGGYQVYTVNQGGSYDKHCGDGRGQRCQRVSVRGREHLLRGRLPVDDSQRVWQEARRVQGRWHSRRQW